jgi:hypothetical protein
MVVVFITIGIRNHFFERYVNVYLIKENIYFELISSGPRNENKYILDKHIDIRKSIISILSWESSATVFEKGAGYPYFSFKITDPDSEPLFFTLILHHDKESLKIIFSKRKDHQIGYVKHIESKAVIEDLLIKLTE